MESGKVRMGVGIIGDRRLAGRGIISQIKAAYSQDQRGVELKSSVTLGQTLTVINFHD